MTVIHAEMTEWERERGRVAREGGAVYCTLLLVWLVGGGVVPTLGAVSEASLDLGVGRREELVVDGEMEADEASVPSTVVVGVS